MTTGPTPGRDLTRVPRAVLSAAAGMVHTLERAVVGDAQVRTARGNAWEAICEDRERARQRDEIRQLAAALAPPVPLARPARQPSVGSSPRSSASQAARFGSGARSGRSAAARARRS